MEVEKARTLYLQDFPYPFGDQKLMNHLCIFCNPDYHTKFLHGKPNFPNIVFHQILNSNYLDKEDLDEKCMHYKYSTSHPYEDQG